MVSSWPSAQASLLALPCCRAALLRSRFGRPVPDRPTTRHGRGKPVLGVCVIRGACLTWPLGYCDRSPLRLFQVSDTSITSKPVWRIALSYLFGAVILAMAINLVASLLS